MRAENAVKETMIRKTGTQFLLANQRVEWWGWGRLELPTYGLGIQGAVLIGVENL